MKKSILLFFLLSGIASAEITYDHKNIDHKEDKNCIALFSLIRDGLVRVNDHDNLSKFTDWQNILILKYAYSKKLNTHADVYKIIWKQKAKDGYNFEQDLSKCITKAGGDL